MDESPNALAQNVRDKRVAIDNDLELLRVRLQNADPRRMQMPRWGRKVLPLLGGTAAAWMWSRRRRRVGSLEQLLVRCVADLYRSELTALPVLDRMARRAFDEELQNAFLQHRAESEGQVERLERVFRSIGAKPPRRHSSPTVAAVVGEGARVFSSGVNRHVRDAWLIAAAQRIEHLEIAGYGTARTYAATLGYTFAAELLERSLEEERIADERFTALARRFINPQAIRNQRA